MSGLAFGPTLTHVIDSMDTDTPSDRELTSKQIYQNARSAIEELERQAEKIRNAPYDSEHNWHPSCEAHERETAALAVEHVIGLHDGTEPGRRGPRPRRNHRCRLCQALPRTNRDLT